MTPIPAHMKNKYKKKKGEKKSRKVSLEDYFHTAATMTMPCGQYGGRIGKGRMVGWGGGVEGT